MKKTIAILFSAALICGSFTACENKKKGTSTTESSDMTMAPSDSDFGMNSAIDASEESAMDSTDDSKNVTDSVKPNTDSDHSEGLVDGLISDGEKIADDIGSAAENAGDAIMGNDN